jgi:hypothetical protein
VKDSSNEERPHVEGQLLRIGLLQRARRFGVPIPDGLMAVIFALSAVTAESPRFSTFSPNLLGVTEQFMPCLAGDPH